MTDQDANVVLPTKDAARALTNQIKAAVEGTWILVREAYVSRAWAALGYTNWDAYCDAEFGATRLALPREERNGVVVSLREAGLSLRAIAAATGTSRATVERVVDASSVSLPRGSETLPPRSVTGSNGKSYQPRPRPAPDIIDAEIVSTTRSAERDDTAVSPNRAKPAPVMLTLRTHTGDEVSYPQPQTKATFNQTEGDGISWAAWSWNPVTGCLHGCDYCYARAIAHRFVDGFPVGFTPLFHNERLDAPANTMIPSSYRNDEHVGCADGNCKVCAYRRVFVCSMADLYGRWVPDEWITQVHASMLATPQWEYLLLTKFPARYVGLDMPSSTWLGTSVDEQKRVRIAEDAFRQVQGVKVKWLSLEPLKEPLQFTDLSIFDWIVIGAQTETRQPTGTVAAFDPPAEWVIRITAQAKEAGCRVHWKPNLRHSLWFNEYPAGAS